MPKKLPKALYRGTLPIGGVELDCYILDDDERTPTRILSASAVFKAFERPQQSMNSKVMTEGIKVPPFMAAKNILPLIDQDILKLITPVYFMDGGVKKRGYKAELLPIICDLYLQVQREGRLLPNQKKIADKAGIMLAAFAKVGVAALIDEATGYQINRKSDALRILLEQYIEDGVRKWMKQFPDEFFSELDRLYGNENLKANQRLRYYGRFISTYIYKPMENEYLKLELDKKNIKDDGERAARFHQWLTDFGKNQLILQIGRVMGVMEISTDIRKCKERIARQKN